MSRSTWVGWGALCTNQCGTDVKGMMGCIPSVPLPGDVISHLSCALAKADLCACQR